MSEMATIQDKLAIEQAMPLSDRWSARTVYQLLSQTAERASGRPAISFQLRSGPSERAETLDWPEFHARVTRTANMFRRLGVGQNDVVAYLMPNCNETAMSLLAGATAGIVNPINPLLDASQIAAILRETRAKVLVTLAPFPKSDLAALAADALRLAPDVETVLEVDLKRYMSPPLSWIIPLIRPRASGGHSARVLSFNEEMARESGSALGFEEPAEDRICAFFHTGGTTGMPKIAQHRQSGMIYNGWCASEIVLSEQDVLFCPLPLFHVFAAYPILMSCVFSGAHMVMPTPQGYRGEGVFDNFWKLIERWQVSFMVMVPTAASALMQRPVDADLSSLKYALCGSAPLPVELFRKFETTCGVKILEGYGMTEATCLVSCNPVHGERRIGSVGLPFPYTNLRIRHFDAEGNIVDECDTDSIGEICISNPGVFPGYREADRNKGVFSSDGYLRTGDLGRIDAEGYLWITGRAKELIIRGGHNIDPAMIEDALVAHPAVAFAGAIGQPDAHSGELPCVYVELIDGGGVSIGELDTFAREKIPERAAEPKYIEVLDELPKTAVGKVFKPALRRMAITRVFNAALKQAGHDAEVAEVTEDRKRGLVARIACAQGTDREAVSALLGRFPAKHEILD